MKEILITNDDGWGSKGILTLARQLSVLGHVTVVAPDGPQSGKSNAISVRSPLYLHKWFDSHWGEEEWQRGVDVYTANGTPSDCVKLALDVLFAGDVSRIGLLASGINHGTNASINVIYSGTIGACFVGAEHGIPSIGFSLCDYAEDADFHYMESYLVEIVQQLLAKPIPYGTCYNVNAPVGNIQGVRWTRQCMGNWESEMEEHVDEKGEIYYWLVGSFVNREPEAKDTDEYALGQGYISIQPCTIDRTAYGSL